MSTKLFCLGITPDSSLGLILKLLRFIVMVPLYEVMGHQTTIYMKYCSLRTEGSHQSTSSLPWIMNTHLVVRFGLDPKDMHSLIFNLNATLLLNSCLQLLVNITHSVDHGPPSTNPHEQGLQ